MQIQWQALALAIGFQSFAVAGAGILAVLPGLAAALDSRYGKPYFLAIVLCLLSGYALAAWGWSVLPAALYVILLTVAVEWRLRRNSHFMDGLIFSCAAAFVGLAGGLAALYAVYRQDLIALFMSAAQRSVAALPPSEAVDQALALVAAATSVNVYNAEMMKNFFAAFEAMRAFTRAELVGIVAPVAEETLRLMTPSWITAMAVNGGLLGWSLPHLALWNARRRGRELPGNMKDAPAAPAFALWSIPRWVSLPMLVMLVLAYVVQYAGWESMLAVSVAVETLVMTAFMVQGMAVVWFWLSARRIRPVGRVTVIAMMYLLLRSLLSWIGLFDMIFGIRRFWALRQQMMAEMRRRRNGREDPGHADDEHKEDEDR